MKNSFCAIFLLTSTAALADTYEVAFNPSSDGKASIINKEAGTWVNIDLNEITAAPNSYGALASHPDDQIYYANGNDRNGFPAITDINGNKIFLSGAKEKVTLINDTTATVLAYGRKLEYDFQTEAITSDQLIAYDQESYDYAVSKGFDVILIEGELNSEVSYSFQSYSNNALNSGVTDGGLLTNKVTTSSGDSMIRSEDDGTVHIGNNSFVFAESGTNGFQDDTMYSSLGNLQIGNNSDHRTIVRGTLEIEEPTAPNHAATKNYVDDSAALAMAMTALPRSYNGKTVVGIAGGHSGDNSAFAFGISKSEIGGNVQLNLNLGYSESTSFAGAAGVGWEF